MPKIPQNNTFSTSREDSSRKARKTSASGESKTVSSAEAKGHAQETVHFINAEVLDPPEQGNINFVGPYVAQVGAMALEDARSFLQGAEQIILAFLGKLAAEAVSGGASPSPLPTAVPQPGAELPLDPKALAGVDATEKTAAATDNANPQLEKDAQGGASTEIPDDPLVTKTGKESTPPSVNMSTQTQQAPASNQPRSASGAQSAAENLEMIQNFMTSLTEFHSSIAETAKNLQGDR